MKLSSSSSNHSSSLSLSLSSCSSSSIRRLLVPTFALLSVMFSFHFAIDTFSSSSSASSASSYYYHYYMMNNNEIWLQQQQQQQQTTANNNNVPTIPGGGGGGDIIHDAGDEASVLLRHLGTSASSSSSSSSSSSTTTNTATNKQQQQRPKIAIISGFVTKPQEAGDDDNNKKPLPRVEEQYMDHIINKACYADLWGYDYIFNTTWGFDSRLTANGNRHWLEYGTWHRVPHMKAALDKYDWIVYTDIDYVFQDMAKPFESFFKEWELIGKNDVHVFIPDDDTGLYTFSAFVVMIRNSKFGHRLIDNWLHMSYGLCPNGNFHTSRPKHYDWKDSDQPGIWYALAKTHSEFYPQPGVHYNVTCNETTGYSTTPRAFGPELNQYFNQIGAKKKSNLRDVPNDQPIIWSRFHKESHGGIGIQQTFGTQQLTTIPHAFAIHKKENLPTNIIHDIESCKKIRQCYAYYNDNENGKLHIGCRNSTSIVVV